MKLEYSLDLEFESILNSNKTSPTIIILPPKEYKLSRETRSDGSIEDEDLSSGVISSIYF